MIDNSINEGSSWIIESADAEYLNFSIYSPLPGSTYIELPRRLRNSMKDLLNTKNNDNKYFLWSHIRYLNPLKIHSERITKANKNMINDHDHEGIECLASRKYFHKIEKKTFLLMYFVTKIIWFLLLMCRMKNVKTV